MSRYDQAEGLRTLFSERKPHLVSIASCCTAVGRSTFVVNLAAALVEHGANVVIIDENQNAGNVCGILGLPARFELIDVLRGDCKLDDVLLHGPRGIMVLPAARGFPMIDGGGTSPRLMPQAIMRLLSASDFVLIDAARGSLSGSALAVPLHKHAVIVSAATAKAVTQTYAWVKDLTRRPLQPALHLALCRARKEEEARTVCVNLPTVTKRYLGTDLNVLGVLGEDHRFPQSARTHALLLDAFPRSRSAAQVRLIAARLDSLRAVLCSSRAGWPAMMDLTSAAA